MQIPEVPYMDSRQIKRKYNLNRGNLTVGGFRSDKGDYMIYILMPVITSYSIHYTKLYDVVVDNEKLFQTGLNKNQSVEDFMKSCNRHVAP